MNMEAEGIYVRAQVREYNKVFVKKDQTEYRSRDYSHKAMYAE
jgi:hypothetical protein